ncbi:BamA/TamA family outer membrane protein [Aminithiophilus ramosus]|uniref:BamA/TamA family outer membrane protein n=1 Tax=Aminithiophilus ramosus TaxID=3029084 RepID=A0A9Q7EWH2_9BACT|nr:BamA/TamA family outer membrane protein [Aminithiophilus ramosus]QTX31630.1 BamA/TamA family outer membrane protein [Aminithiophilus ramosus]
MRRLFPGLALFIFLALFPLVARAQEPLVAAVNVEGNSQVVSSHILGVVGTKPGDPIDREQVRKDIEAIYSLGFFSLVDVRVESLPAGLGVIFVVQENPVVTEVRFEGNEVYSDEQLHELVFTAEGNVFNRVFFRHDLQRIQERYQKDGYVLVKIGDVQVDGGVVTVQIMEPRVGEIIIQGNTRTRTRVIEREIKVKTGDIFNSTVLRHSLNRIQGMGYFEDVNVGFEPTESPEVINLVLTVVEQKTGRVGISLGHGSQSGWSGGLSYEDTNWQGLGHKASIGFETGDRQQYWISYEQPYMDFKTYSWRVGVYKREWEDLDYYLDGSLQLYDYEEDRTGAYVGVGKKFHNELYSWYVTLDWRDTDIRATTENYKGTGSFDDFKRDYLKDGKTFSVTGTVKRSTLDEMVSYPKGDVESVNVEKAFEVLGGEYDYTKYWVEARYYTPLWFLQDLFDAKVGDEDNPIILAARVRSGWSSGTLPVADQYEIGGKTTLRGFDDDKFKGDEMFLANVEVRVPIEKAFSFVLFYDTGMAWNTQTTGIHSSYSLSDLEGAFGFGVRVRTPIGNLRLDVAEGDEETKTHFGFGEMF